MNREFTLDLLEQKKSLLYVAGIALTPLATGDRFTLLYRDGRSAKQRQRVASVDLTIDAILIDGEPVTAVEAGQAALLALSGDAAELQEQAVALGWREKSGRVLRLSGQALTLSDEA